MSAPSSIRCAFCGRVTLKPVAYVGLLPVGSTCARRNNLGGAIRESRCAVRPAKADRHQSVAKRDARTMDLFSGAAT